MPRIPIYNSRVSAPGPIPRLGDDLAAPGRALQRLGGAIAGFGENLVEREEIRKKRDKNAENAPTRPGTSGRPGEQPDGADSGAVPTDLSRATAPSPLVKTVSFVLEPEGERPPGAGTDGGSGARERDGADRGPEKGGEGAPKGGAAAVARGRSARMDHVSDKVTVAEYEAKAAEWRAVWRTGPALTEPAVGLHKRTIAAFNAFMKTELAAIGDPGLRAAAEAAMLGQRAVLSDRALIVENRRRIGALNGQLESLLLRYEQAASADPTSALAMLLKGEEAIAEGGRAAGLDESRIAELKQGWGKRFHVRIVEGGILRNPALVLNLLETGEIDEALGHDEEVKAGLIRKAERARDMAAAREAQAAKTRRKEFELQKAEYLKDLRETGTGDAAVLTLAGQVLDEAGLASFRGEAEAAEAHHAARERYAFMTEAEIAADIAQKAPGGGPRDSDERQAAHETRTATRDEILAERRKDLAGWAMRDETVAAAFAAAEQAEAAAQSPESTLEDAQKADRLHRRALALRLQAQRDMGEEPRLLAEAERDDLAEELAALTPTERLARLRDLKRRFGEHYDGLAKELAGRVAPDTEILMVRAGDPALAGALARGMEMDSAEFKGARVLWLPMMEGRLDKSRLEDKQLYQLTVGGRTVGFVYDRKADALVPAVGEKGDLPSLAPDIHPHAEAAAEAGKTEWLASVGGRALERDASLAATISDPAARKEYERITTRAAERHKKALQHWINEYRELFFRRDQGVVDPDFDRKEKWYRDRMAHFAGLIRGDRAEALRILEQHGTTPKIPRTFAEQSIRESVPESTAFETAATGNGSSEEIRLSVRRDLRKLLEGPPEEFAAYLKEKGLTDPALTADLRIVLHDLRDAQKHKARAEKKSDTGLVELHEEKIAELEGQLGEIIDEMADEAAFFLSDEFKTTKAAIERNRKERAFGEAQGDAWRRGKGEDHVADGVQALNATAVPMDKVTAQLKLTQGVDPVLTEILETDRREVVADQMRAIARIAEGLRAQADNPPTSALAAYREAASRGDIRAKDAYFRLDPAIAIEAIVEGIARNPAAFATGMTASIIAAVFFPPSLIVDVAMATGGAAIDTVAEAYQTFGTAIINELKNKDIDLTDPKKAAEAVAVWNDPIQRAEILRAAEGAWDGSAMQNFVREFVSNYIGGKAVPAGWRSPALDAAAGAGQKLTSTAISTVVSDVGPDSDGASAASDRSADGDKKIEPQR